jgi:signal transduction histidine kinase/ActR/RegA family two-component response regulator
MRRSSDHTHTSTGLSGRTLVPWGTHLCHFYRTGDDLAETLVPYFAAGLAHNEQCLWITSDPLRAEAAHRALRAAVPDLDRCVNEGRITIVNHDHWYVRQGTLRQDRVLSGWLEQERRALDGGFEGLRISGNLSWLDPEDWAAFRTHEAELHQALHSRRILALCSYSVDRCRIDEMLDVLKNHRSALVMHNGHWELVETATGLVSVLGAPLTSADADPSAHRALPAQWTHAVQFAHEASLPAAAIGAFLSEGLHLGEAAIAIARPDHLDAILDACANNNVDVVSAVRDELLLTLEAEPALDALMDADRPDASRFASTIGSLIMRMTGGGRRLRIYGEMVDVLRERGQFEAVLALEEIWNDVLQPLPARLLCGYALERFDGEDGVRNFRAVCARHEHVSPAHGDEWRVPADPRQLVAELQLRARQAEAESHRRRKAERAERAARLELQAAHDRLAQLQRITSALSQSVAPEDIGQVVVSEMARVVGADQLLLAIPEVTGGLRVLAHRGVSDDAVAQLGALTLPTMLPATDAHRYSVPLWIASAAEMRRRYPGLSMDPAAVVVASLPSNAAGHGLGLLAFGYSQPRRFAALDRALLQDLARQVGGALERARLYEAARTSEAQLADANRRKDEFMALLGHELRNPLAPIATALQLMKMSGKPVWAQERAVIERQVAHVSRLVDDLLDVSRITKGKLELKKVPVDVTSVVHRALELASPLIERRRHHLLVETPSDPIWIDADLVRMAQAVANLLTNAAKFTDQGGSIALRVRADGDEVAIRIEDTGVGISPDVVSDIFEPFVQASRTVEHAQGGLGIGLALVKSLVELHGGGVSAFSRGVGTGSAFEIRVPTIPASAQTARQSAPEAPRASALALARRRVLIVDDNPDAADALAVLLRAQGHEPLVTYDGAGALDVAGRTTVDVALLDINLPVIDGYEVARLLRKKPGGRATRFVAMTGFGATEDRLRSEAAGFVAHLVKPIDHDSLLAILSETSAPLAC